MASFQPKIIKIGTWTIIFSYKIPVSTGTIKCIDGTIVNMSISTTANNRVVMFIATDLPNRPLTNPSEDNSFACLVHCRLSV
jgi:hypothetical protein